MKIIVTIYLLLVIVYSSRADWEKCEGPYRGEITNIVEHNGYMFALTSYSNNLETTISAAIRSSDGGLSWSKVKDLPFFIRVDFLVNCLLVFNDVLYILNDPYSSWSSTDNGESWNRLQGDSFLYYLRAKTLDQPLNIYDIIDVNGRYISLTQRGIYVSDDEGLQWQKKYDLINYDFWHWKQSIVGKLYHVQNTLYFTTNAGLYYSEDNGDTWEKDSVTDNAAFSFYVHDGIMYLGVEGGIYRSLDKGETWEFTWIKDNIIACFSSRNDTVYCLTSQTSGFNRFAWRGVLYSIDKGKNWLSNSVLRNLADARAFFFNDSLMFVGTVDNGIYRSSDGGKNWLQTGYITQPISALTSMNGNLVVGVEISSNNSPRDVVYRIYTSPKDRSSWILNDFTIANIYASKNVWVSSLLVNDKTIFANVVSTNSLGVLRTSKDVGITWDLRKSYGIMFKRPHLQQDTLFAYDKSASFFSTDNGESWDTLSRELTFYDNYVVTKTGVYFSLGMYFRQSWDVEPISNGKLYISKDSAATWQEILIMDIDGVYLLYSYEGTIYISTNKGIYSTIDGETWHKLSGAIRPSSLVVVDNYLYAGTDYGLYKRELLPSSIEEISFDSSIQLYPNPAQEFLYIKASTPYDTVSIFSILGDKVMDIVTSKDVIDISSLESGYYQVIVQSQTLQQRASLSIMR
jgi:hypothetical protein